MIIRPPKRKPNKRRAQPVNKKYKSQFHIDKIKEEMELTSPKTKYRKKEKKPIEEIQSSIGETMIADFLLKNGIRFKREKIFRDLRNPLTGSFLRVDFWIFASRTMIEFDGIQHYKASKLNNNGADLPAIQTRDRMKDHYAESKGYQMIRIHYKDMNRISDILTARLGLKK